MNPSNPAKFGIAFALGLVVALAGVTVYVKSSGLHVQETPPAVTASPAAATTKPPETLNAPKAEEPPPAPAIVPTPAPAVVAEAPKVVPSPPPPVAKKVAVRSTPPRAHFPPHTFPHSESTIRVEVSQLHKPTDPATSQTPLLVPASQTIRVVDEEQARPVPPPVPVAPVPIPVAPPQPHTVTLQSGTNVSIRLGETLSTDHNFSGDTFRGTLDRPIILDGFVIAEKGSKVLGKIAGLDKGGKFEGGSNLQLSLTEINTTDGQRVRIQTGFINRKGPASNGGEVARVGGGAVLGAIIGGLAGGGKGAAIGAGAGGAVGAGTVMAGKGRPAVIPTETQLTFQLAAPTTITERLN